MAAARVYRSDFACCLPRNTVPARARSDVNVLEGSRRRRFWLSPWIRPRDRAFVKYLLPGAYRLQPTGQAPHAARNDPPA